MEKVHELIRLVQENPEMEVKFCISEDACRGDYAWEEGRIATVEKGLYCLTGDEIFTDEYSIKENIVNNLDIAEYKYFKDDVLDKLVDRLYETHEKKEVILVYMSQ